MPYEPKNLICIAGNAQTSHWAYRTSDRPGEVLAPGYFPDDPMVNFMLPGELLTLTCLPANDGGMRRARNPIAVLQAVTARTLNGVWLLLPLTPITRPAQAVAEQGIGGKAKAKAGNHAAKQAGNQAANDPGPAGSEALAPGLPVNSARPAE